MSIKPTVQGQCFLKFKEDKLWAKLTHEGGSLGTARSGAGQGPGDPDCRREGQDHT